jgi:hypothetical protein
LQLGDATSRDHSGGSSLEGGFGESIQANSDGNCVNSTGKFRFMADRTLLDMPLDVSSLNLDWVAGTTDKLFRDLTVPQRTILFLYFHEEQSFKTMGKTFSTDAQTMRSGTSDAFMQAHGNSPTTYVIVWTWRNLGSSEYQSC